MLVWSLRPFPFHLLEVVINVSTISAQHRFLVNTTRAHTKRVTTMPNPENKRLEGGRKGDDFLYFMEVIVSGGKIKFIRGYAIKISKDR